ncbi:MAG: GNAT family N-acetyltransferase [Robiginitalea sp.]
MIRTAKLTDIPNIMRLTKACAADLCKKGIYQWNEKYPSIEAFMADIVRGELWVLEGKGQLVGTVVLSEIMDTEYKTVKWMTGTGDNRYVHRLAVHPQFQGRGYASELMDFAEGRARSEGASSIRLDTFSQNKRNQRFYERRGYTRLGSVYFPQQSAEPFYCYELPLSSPGEPCPEP